MFVGHYAAAFVLKAKEPKASLGMLFLATQFVDILYFPFAVIGLEKMTFVENYNEVNNFQMEFPFTHGLVGSLFWAVMIYLLYFYGVKRNYAHKKQVAFVMGLAVLSHWFVDLIVHTPDLPLLSGEPKFGFGLWYYKELTFFVEGLLLLSGWIYYMYNTKSINKWYRYFAFIFLLFLLLVNYINFYVIPPAMGDLAGLMASALFSYFLLALLAYLMDKGRMYSPA